ncbi:MAG: metallophosphoesterase [Thermotogota bacterium]|nr:metallophosphoesterase [Thermotogota bacterium]
MRKIVFMILFYIFAVSINATFLNRPDSDMVSIKWYTEELSDSRIHCIDEAGNEIHLSSSEMTNFHSLTLENMKKDQLYHYQAESYVEGKCVYKDEGLISLVEEKSFDFVIYGDSRGNFKNHKKICEGIATTEPLLVINVGDLVYRDAFIEDWAVFYKAIDVLPSSFYYSAVGNHEKAAKNFRELLDLSGNELYYSFKEGKVLFIVLNTNQRFDRDSKQYRWLVEVLENRDLEQTEFTIVVTHHPPYSYSSHGDTYFMKLILVPLFERYNIDLVISGHDHSYQRIEKGNIDYIVTAGGGAPLYKIEPGDDLIKGLSVYHYVVFSYSPGAIDAKVIDINGNLIDQFSIIK